MNPTGDVGVLPLDGLDCLVVPSDVAHELLGEVVGRGEDAAGDDVALDLAQPDHPRYLQPRLAGPARGCDHAA